jgi:hypothetical protein
MDARASTWGTGVPSFCSPRRGVGELAIGRSLAGRSLAGGLEATAEGVSPPCSDRRMAGVETEFRGTEDPPGAGIAIPSGVDTPCGVVEPRAEPPRRVTVLRVALPTRVLLGGSSPLVDCILLCPAFCMISPAGRGIFATEKRRELTTWKKLSSPYNQLSKML